MTDVEVAYRVLGMAMSTVNYPVLMLAFALFVGTLVVLKRGGWL
ncbi:hypothetical protein [Kallotenue papyrolyticum]|nr:hypothetical protein [Kallotenue papyrolyticum]